MAEARPKLMNKKNTKFSTKKKCDGSEMEKVVELILPSIGKGNI